MNTCRTGPAIEQDRNGKWWGCLEVAEFGGHFDTSLIRDRARDGVWLYDGSFNPNVIGPFRDEANARAWLANEQAQNAALDAEEARLNA